MSKFPASRALAVVVAALGAFGVAVHTPAGAAPAQLTAEQKAELLKSVKANAQREIRVEEQRNVGKPLPASVSAFNDQDERVRLRDVLQGPAVVVKTEVGCPPCERMLAFLRAHGPDFARRHYVQIVVWNTAAPPRIENPSGGDPTGQEYPRDMPSSITVLHVKDYGTHGFLGGTWFPTIFFFDGNKKLVARRIATRGEPAEWLRPPPQLGATR